MALVVAVGAINVDLTVVADRLPVPGSTVLGRDVARAGGGKGANAAVAAAAAGAHVRLVGAVGADDAGGFALDGLRAAGVDVAGVHVAAHRATGQALIVVDGRGENQIAVGVGANETLAPERVAEAVAGADCVLVSTEVPDDCVFAAVRAAAEAGVPCVLDPAPVTAAVHRVLARNGPPVLLTPNAGEARELTGSEGPDALAALADRIGGPVVVTRGALGALVVRPGGGVTEVPAPRVADVLDTTGAGDCFTGTLAAALAARSPLEDAVHAAVAASARSVRYRGARPGPQ